MSAARQLFESALRAPVLRVEKLERGARRVRYVGEATSRNTERDTLCALEVLGLNAGMDVGLEISRDPHLWINPEEDTEPRRLGEHPEKCGCRDCDPDFYIDPAELEAGRGEKICGAEEQRKESSSMETAPSGAMAWR